MPHLMNCPHKENSHCLDWVKKEWERQETRIEQYRIALADAIRRHMGVVPDSADGIITVKEMDEAEQRRPKIFIDRLKQTNHPDF